MWGLVQAKEVHSHLESFIIVCRARAFEDCVLAAHAPHPRPSLDPWRNIVRVAADMDVPASMGRVKLKRRNHLRVTAVLNAKQGLILTQRVTVVDKQAAVGAACFEDHDAPVAVAELVGLGGRLRERERRPRHLPRRPGAMIGDRLRGHDQRSSLHAHTLRARGFKRQIALSGI